MIALVGLRCSGKTSAGRELARLLDRPFVDLDDEVAAESPVEDGTRSTTAGHVLAQLGPAAFRELERRALERVLGRGLPLVLATGGGAIETPEARALLRERTTAVWLRADVARLQERLARDPAFRPPLEGPDPASELPAVAARREALYREVAALALDCGTDDPPRIARRILEALPAAAGRAPERPLESPPVSPPVSPSGPAGRPAGAEPDPGGPGG